MLRVLLASFILCCLGCGSKRPAVEFQKVAEDFVYRSLAFSPINATSQGLHEFEGRKLDSELDNLSRPAIQQQRDYYAGVHRKLMEFDREALSAEDQADFDIIDTQCGLALFESDGERVANRNPTTYVELLGSALFSPSILEYAPKPNRFQHIIERMEKVPGFLEVAQRQLFAAPQIWINVAMEEDAGNLELIDKALANECPLELKPKFDAAAALATEAIRRFDRFLKNDLSTRRPRGQTNLDDRSDWRLGPDSYAVKFKLALGTSRTPDEILQEAQNRLKQVRTQMFEIAQTIANSPIARSSDEAQQTATIASALQKIALNHSTPASYLDDARKDLSEATSFVREKNLLSLPPASNLQVIPTPVFMRGLYAVGGFNPAPTLEPKLGAYYWVTPIPNSWTKERSESKLREYNFYKLKLLTIHEAMPGHYVQAEFANGVEPKTRRILRALYGNVPYVEGWAQYATQTVLDEGFLGKAPEVRLTFLKEELRVIANAIIDIQLQTKRMTEDEALALMEKQTFQEHEEAVAKIQRAQLSSAQLPAYFVGWRDWLSVREALRKQQGAAFDLKGFHDRALKEGAVPLPVLQRLLLRKPS